MIKLDGMGFGFFIPVFFIMVGVKFDPAHLGEFDNTLIPFLLMLLNRSERSRGSQAQRRYSAKVFQARLLYRWGCLFNSVI